MMAPVFASCPEPCDTEECLTLLARLLEVRNATIDPCEDFYGYACGNWEANHLRTETMESSNVFDVLLEENQLILKRLLGREGRWMVYVLPASSSVRDVITDIQQCSHSQQGPNPTHHLSVTATTSMNPSVHQYGTAPLGITPSPCHHNPQHASLQPSPENDQTISITIDTVTTTWSLTSAP